MKHNQPHALPYPTGDTFDHLVSHRAMVLVAPPDKHVGLGKAGFRQAVLGLLQRRGRGGDRLVGVQRVGNRGVHAFPIDAGDHLVGPLMDILAPNDSAYCHSVLVNDCQGGAAPAVIHKGFGGYWKRFSPSRLCHINEA